MKEKEPSTRDDGRGGGFAGSGSSAVGAVDCTDANRWAWV
jgi:hypothetical protein